MSRPVVVVTDPIHPYGIEQLQAAFDVRRFGYSVADSDKEAIEAAVADADLLVVRAMPVTGKLLDRARRLSLVVKHGAGIDNIDVVAATSRDILVANCGEANARAVAEATVALMFAAIRRIPELHRIVLERRFARNWFVQRWQTEFQQLSERTLGLVGFGNIARHVARMCVGGFEMKAIAYDPFLSRAEMERLGVEKIETVAELCARADILSVHAPLKPETRHMIGAAEMALLRPHAILVHTSRGGVVDEKALYAALKEGRLAGAALDVHEVEPPREGNPLYELPNIVLTPHVGAGTEETHKAVAAQVARIVRGYAEGRRPATLINGDVWARRRPLAGA